MKKITRKKSSPTKRTKRNPQSILFVRYTSVAFALLVAAVAFKFLVAASSNVHVLGASTGPVLLARGGEDETETEHQNGQEQPEPPHQESNSGSGGQNSGGNGQSSNTTSPTDTQPSPSSDTKVDCVGPDGKHFVTSFHDCQELNAKWGRKNFEFTKVGASSESKKTEDKQKTIIPQTLTGQQTPSKLEVRKEGSKTEIKLEKPGSHIEIKREDDGRVKVKEKNEDGTEVELEEKDTIEKLNAELEDKGIEIGTGSAKKFAFKKGKIEAHTDFPLTVDPTTKQLSVTTESGTHDVTVLPDKAVQNLLDKKVLTNVVSTGTPTSGSVSDTNNVVGLTEVDNKPAFEIHGVKDKKVIGLFPVAFTKTVYVSAEDGKVLKTQQGTWDKILEFISF